MTYKVPVSIFLALCVATPALAQTQPAQSPFSQAVFTDVPTNSPHYTAVEYLRENNVLKGYPDGTFRPNRRINRGEFVKLVINPFILDTQRINECLPTYAKTGDTVFFSDVSKDSFFAAEACFAKIKHIIDGYPDGKFRPGGYISFVEAAKILANVFSLQVATEPTGEQWYAVYAKRLAEIRAIPTNITTFDQMLTRGDMAQMLYRMKTKKQDLPSQSYGNLK